METSLDKFGRIVIPKRVRDELGLTPGAPLRVRKSGHKILLEPLDETPRVTKEGGILVFQGEAMESQEALRNAVNNHRKGRLHRIISASQE